MSSPTPASDFYQVVGQNNRNVLVQSRKLSPYHEDTTKLQPFEPAEVNPGTWTVCKLDFKHSAERELILNDLRLQFYLDFSASPNIGRVLAVRGTDLIRELIVKINNEEVFHVRNQFELSMLYEMNNHKTAGDPSDVDAAHMLNYGVIPQGHIPSFVYHSGDTSNNPKWYFKNDGTTPTNFSETASIPGEERWDGRPRVIYDDTVNPKYMFRFDMSFNHIIGPIVHRLHLRRIEFLQVEILFEPWTSKAVCQNFLMFENNPPATHPYSVAKYRNLQIRQYRTTLLDGIHGFTLPDNRMLSWLMHRYSRREYLFNFDTMTSIDIQLHDWEMRNHITRVFWMLAPKPTDGTKNTFRPFGEPCEGYDVLSGVEILWKNEKVLDLDTHYEVYRHYLLSDNKRYGYDHPFMRFARLMPNTNRKNTESDGSINYWDWFREETDANSAVNVADQIPEQPIGKLRYEFPIYHVDFHMNIQQGVQNGEIVGGITNDTSDYVIRIKRLADRNSFVHTGQRVLWVWIEYQTLVNLAANSNQFNRASQLITKQLNPI